jgi:hypothetical protein
MTLKSILTWFGIIGSVASIISLAYIFIPQESKLNLSVQTTNIENLTQSSERIEPELKAQYQYKGAQIKNLWKYNIRFINISKKTLVGVSNQKNILTDFLSFKENAGLEILDYKNVSNQFNHKLYLDSTGINIYFEQWRPNEYLEYVFYVKANGKNPNPILFGQLGFRQIVDGDITFSIEQKNTAVKRITQVIPTQGRQATYVISLIFTGLFIIIFTIFVFLTPFSYYKANKWYKKNQIDFIQFIHETFPGKIDIQDKYILRPKDLPKHFWRKFKGEKFPDLSVDLDIKKFYPFVITVTIFMTIDLSLIVTFIDLVYYFP